jgi:stage V sporulation protein G
LSNAGEQEGEMEITEVRVSITKDKDARLKAFVNVTFDHCFAVRGMKVIEGPKGLFVSMPRRKRADGTSQDVAHPINNEMRSKLEGVVLSAYQKEAERAGSVVVRQALSQGEGTPSGSPA